MSEHLYQLSGIVVDLRTREHQLIRTDGLTHKHTDTICILNIFIQHYVQCVYTGSCSQAGHTVLLPVIPPHCRCVYSDTTTLRQPQSDQQTGTCAL